MGWVGSIGLKVFHGRGLLALRRRPALPPLVPTVPASDNHRAVPTRTRGREHTCPPPPSSPFMWLARSGKVQLEFSTDFTLGQRNFDMVWHLTEFRNHMTSLSFVELLGHISGTFYLNWQVPIANWPIIPKNIFKISKLLWKVISAR